MLLVLIIFVLLFQDCEWCISVVVGGAGKKDDGAKNCLGGFGSFVPVCEQGFCDVGVGEREN